MFGIHFPSSQGSARSFDFIHAFYVSQISNQSNLQSLEEQRGYLGGEERAENIGRAGRIRSTIFRDLRKWQLLVIYESVMIRLIPNRYTAG